MTFDTLGYVKTLEAAGVERKIAEAHAEALRDHILSQLVPRRGGRTLSGGSTGTSAAQVMLEEIKRELTMRMALIISVASAAGLALAKLLF